MTFDSGGNLVVLDRDNWGLRRIDKASGLISSIVGEGGDGIYHDGIPSMPRELAFGPDGNLYMAGWGNGLIWMMEYTAGRIFIALGYYDPGHPGFGRPNPDFSLINTGVSIFRV